MSEQEQNQFFEEYGKNFLFRDDGKLKPRPRGKRLFWILPTLLFFVFLLSGLVGYKYFWVPSKVSLQSSNPIQPTTLPLRGPLQDLQDLPNQQTLTGNLQRLSIGDAPSIIVRNLTGSVFIYGAPISDVIIEATVKNPIDRSAIHYAFSNGNHTLTVQVGRIPSGSTSTSISLKITVPDNASLDVQAPGIVASDMDGQLVLTSESINVYHSILHGHSFFQATNDITFFGGVDPQGIDEFHCGSGIQMSLPSNGSFHFDFGSHGAAGIANYFKKVDVGPAPRATVIIRTTGYVNIGETMLP